jgi:hypothetical protein
VFTTEEKKLDFNIAPVAVAKYTPSAILSNL